ncbi:uncharacterized protein LTR77_007788 [Saxophila tyrrhenica]|uniref:STEEP1 domain-containing protein n=1 Tax=Saxophila tyrrhenica TaxID=1690608 RepID=A0AAV9P3Q8_9PEZI|nr:hypothetical protein LTR77_007788 [Saxophila tyrrhenica]
MSKTQVHTYHCLCTELVLATYAPLQSLPKRKADHAAICKLAGSDLPIPGGVVLSGSSFDDAEPIVLNLEDGFEKRYAARCKRCDLQIGYWLDKSQFEPEQKGRRTDVMYLLPGGLMSTEEMKEKKDMGKEVEMAGAAGG